MKSQWQKMAQNSTEQYSTGDDVSDFTNVKSSPRAQRSGNARKVNPYEVLYLAYPRKVGKKVAIDAIKRAVDRVESRTKAEGATKLDAQRWLYARTLAFARSPAGNRGNLTPHPATWFNQGRYDDNPTEWEQIGDGTNQQRSGFGRTKSERNLDALREAIGLAPAMDMRATGAGGERAAGDHIGGGFACTRRNYGTTAGRISRWQSGSYADVDVVRGGRPFLLLQRCSSWSGVL